jgi:hypothetical protein
VHSQWLERWPCLLVELLELLLGLWLGLLLKCEALLYSLGPECLSEGVMTTCRPCAEEACGIIVDIDHKSKIVRLMLQQLIVDQALNQAQHLDQAQHWALNRGPFLSPGRFDNTTCQIVLVQA